MKDAFLRAQALYKKKQYRLALEILESNASVKSLGSLSTIEQVGALDLLASLCEKQALLPRARSYAVRMISLKETDPRGYFRLGKVLQLMPGREGEAAKVYQRALVKVSPLSPGCREFLKKQLALTSQKQRSNRVNAGLQHSKCDPVSALPHDVLLLVFGQLTLRERCRSTQVSRTWRQVLNGETAFWSDLVFDARGSDSGRAPIVSPDTVYYYCSRSTSSQATCLDFQQVLVRDSRHILTRLATLKDFCTRLVGLKFDTLTPIAEPPIVSMLRSSTSFSRLRQLKLYSQTPESDLCWCLENLPDLEVLDLTTTSRIQPERPRKLRKLSIVTNKLCSLSFQGRTERQVLSDFVVAQLSALPCLRSIDLHRVVPNMWPTMLGAICNANLTRFGFTASRSDATLKVSPLPKFSSELDSLTLNDLTLSSVFVPPILPDGNRYSGGSSSAFQSIRYLELKRVSFLEFTLPELLTSWGCTDTLETLVIHAFHSEERTPFPSPGTFQFRDLPQLQTLQFTNMGTLLDDQLEWIVNACPNLRKINFEGTTVTGPMLVTVLKVLPKLQAVRCKHTVNVSADTIAWIRQLREVAVTF